MIKKKLIHTSAPFIIRLCLLGVILFISPTYLAGQDLSYARAVVDTLSAPSMHGRAYVREGDRLAARYISREFKRWGLELLGLDYYQPLQEYLKFMANDTYCPVSIIRLRLGRAVLRATIKYGALASAICCKPNATTT